MRVRGVLILLLAIHAGLLAWSATRHSPTLNEPGHLAAGISHWQFGRFELYRVNPPLVRMVAAVPVLAAGVATDWTRFYEGPGARPVFAIGEDLIAANGPRSLWLFTIARWACIPFSLIGGVVCYLWARDLYGHRAGLAAATLWCFSPNILGHASLITADAPAAALGLAACYTFWRWLARPAWSQTVLAGVVLGVAELAKTTLVVFYPLWPLLWIFYRLPDRIGARHWAREAVQLLVTMAIGIYVINLGYGFEGSLRRLKDFSFVSCLLTGEDGRPVGNRFAGTRLGQLPLPLPKNYLLGMDIQRKDFEQYSRPSYLRGAFRETGWWYYYLYALGIKVPLGTWGLLVLVVLWRMFGATRSVRPTKDIALPAGGSWLESGTKKGPGVVCAKHSPGRSGKRLPTPFSTTPFSKSDIDSSSIASCSTAPVSHGTRLRDELILLLPALALLTLVSSQTGFSEHMRYVLPVLPFVFVWISQVARPGFPSSSRTAVGPARGPAETGDPFRFRVASLTACSAVILFGWSVASSLSVYPHSLAYFNELVGGPEGGPRHLLSSNIDWGQDLIYLKEWVEQHPEAGPLHLAYFGYFDPARIGLVFSAPAAADRDLPVDPPGVYAISVNFLYGFPWFLADGHGGKTFYGRDALARFRHATPIAHAGYSIYLFRVSRAGPHQPAAVWIGEARCMAVDATSSGSSPGRSIVYGQAEVRELTPNRTLPGSVDRSGDGG